ncbi:MAG: hypothetical protein WCL02_00195 [bacterium]
MAQYGNFQNFTWETLDQARNARKSWIKKLTGKYIQTNTVQQYSFYQKCLESISDNMNTPKLFAEINQGLNDKVEGVYETISYLEDHYLKLGLFEAIIEETIDIPADIVALAEVRREAKAAKDYAKADEVRNQITALGREVKDTKDGYEIHKL